MGDVLGTWGIVLAAIGAGSSLAMGVAAATVRPWSWYVLLAYQLFVVIWGALYVTFVARDLEAGAIVAVFSLGMAMVCFAYFYKRRALFGARWRWQWPERSWPRLAGPEIVGPDARPGFRGLPPQRRWLFVAATVIWVLMQLLSAA
jgi:hypothetical protein